MAFKFFNIGKANEEIEKLDSSVAELTAERDAVKSNLGEVEAAAEAFKFELTNARSKIIQLESELSTAKQSILSVTSERDAAISAQKISDEKLANPPEQIKTMASAQAAAITASIGVPPVASAFTSKKGEFVSRAEFGAMSVSDRFAFVKAGGKISE